MLVLRLVEYVIGNGKGKFRAKFTRERKGEMIPNWILFDYAIWVYVFAFWLVKDLIN